MLILLQEDGGEDEGRMLRMGKRLLRSLSLVFGCLAFASLVSGTIQILHLCVPSSIGIWNLEY